jgi:hypothetical protein
VCALPGRHTNVVHLGGKKRRVWQLRRSSLDEIALADGEAQAAT